MELRDGILGQSASAATPEKPEDPLARAITRGQFDFLFPKTLRRQASNANFHLRRTTRVDLRATRREIDGQLVARPPQESIIKHHGKLVRNTEEVHDSGKEIRVEEKRQDRKEFRAEHRKKAGIAALALMAGVLVVNVKGAISGGENQASALGSGEKSKPSDNKEDGVPPVEHEDESTPPKAPKAKPVIPRKDVTIDGAFKKNSKGPTIVGVEEDLVALGCKIGTRPGVLEDIEVTSVELVQGNLKIPVDGIPGKVTRGAMERAVEAGNTTTACGA